MKPLKLALVFGLLGCTFVSPETLPAQTPEWIWHDNQGAPTADNEVRFFRKPFNLDGAVPKAVLSVACDNAATVFLNGKRVLTNRSWDRPATANVAKDLKSGENLIAI